MADFGRRRAAYDDWARYYDLLAGDRAAMAAFYRSLVTDRTRSILDLACGTGTITLALVQRLVGGGDTGERRRVVAIDESAEMLRIARTKDALPAWLLGDMRSPPIGHTFDLVICSFNTVQSLLSDADLIAFFGSVRRMVNPAGVFAFDIVQPDPEYLNTPHSDHLVCTITDERGRFLEDRRDHCYDLQSRVLSIEHRLIEAGGDAAVPLARVQLEYRQWATDEVDHALAVTGFAVGWRYGDFDRSRLGAASKKQIFVCSPS